MAVELNSKNMWTLLDEVQMKDGKPQLEIKIPDNYYQVLLESVLERGYLNETGNKTFYNIHEGSKDFIDIHWLQMARLPVRPNDGEDTDLLSRWQGVLTGLHAWNYRVYFLLLRNSGETKLFIGASSKQGNNLTSDIAIEQIRECVSCSMPGVGLNVIGRRQNNIMDILGPMSKMKYVGAVTGIPAFKDGNKNGTLQTLDSLAFGIREQGVEKNYAMLVIADPIDDREIAGIIANYRNLGSQIHTAVRSSAGKTATESKSENPNAGKQAKRGMIGTIGGALLGLILGAGSGVGVGAMIGSSISNSFSAPLQQNISVSEAVNVNLEYLDKFAEYAETTTDYHIERLNQGRNYGMWNTGVYILGEETQDVVTVSGMLRALYSGDKTYFEPIRLHLFGQKSNALSIVRDHFDLLPMFNSGLDPKHKNAKAVENYQWNNLGKCYQYVSTPMNTMELSIATSLPHRDVPGLRFVKTAVHFANNPALTINDFNRDSSIELGKIVDTGVEQSNSYVLDINSLVRHTLISGTTGSGKSTTCKKLLSGVLKKDIPVMVIEPAKTDYVRWAIEMNKNLPDDRKFRIFMPGVEEYDGVPMEKLRINGFEPACVPGAKVDLLQHSEQFNALLNASLPSEDVVPILIGETIDTTISDFAKLEGKSLTNTTSFSEYPTVDDMLRKAEYIIDRKQYDPKVQSNMKEVLMTRLKHLSRGMRGEVINTERSTDFDRLFSGNVIINLSCFSDTKDLALIMSLLINALYEYRKSKYTNDLEYRAEAQKNKLMHLLLVEEAHNVLSKPDNTSSGNPRKAAADLFSKILSEIREYGQGLVIVDQVPVRLIDDAVKNTNYKIVHRLQAADDIQAMSACLALREEQKTIIPTLEIGNTIVRSDLDDGAMWVKVLKN